MIAASGPTPTFASDLDGTFANFGIKGPLANLLMLVGALDLTFAARYYG
jgi:hypothetical protein